MWKDTICCQEFFFKVTPRYRKIEMILRQACENFKSQTIPQCINHAIVQIAALSLDLLDEQLSKLFHISSVLFACFIVCPVLFSFPLVWNAIYKIHRYCLPLHQLSFECWATKRWEIKQISDRIGRESHASSTSYSYIVRAATSGFNPKLSILLLTVSQYILLI